MNDKMTKSVSIDKIVSASSSIEYMQYDVQLRQQQSQDFNIITNNNSSVNLPTARTKKNQF